MIGCVEIRSVYDRIEDATVELEQRSNVSAQPLIEELEHLRNELQ